MTRLSICVFLAFIVVAPADGARAQTPVFFPVYDNHLVLPFSCPPDDDLAWSQAFADSIAGLGPGDDVSLLYNDGTTKAGSLGPVTCLRGECRGDYVALPVMAPALSERIIAVAAASWTKPAIALQATETPSSCRGLPAQGADPHGFGFPATAPLCTTHSLRTDTHDLSILVAGQGWMQENGWPIYQFHYRVDGADAAPGTWVELDEGTAALTPGFAWMESSGAIQLLWTRREGIAGPPAITFREQSIEHDGGDEWISTYQAGGQPCD